MAQKLETPVDGQEYGAQVQEEQNAEALAATAAMEAETTPQVQLPEAEAATQQPEAEPQAPPTSGGLQPRNLMQIVPPSLLFRGKVTNPAKMDRNVALLYEAVASSPYASELTRTILNRLRGDSGA